MDLNSKINNSQSFGMAFSRGSAECNNYLAFPFKHKSHKFKKALKELDKRCDAHKYFDMFHSSHDDSIKIIGKTDIAGQKMAEKYGDTILSLSKNVKHPNYAQQTRIRLNELEHSNIGPQNGFERMIFKLFNYFHMKYANLHVKCNPYENLPDNVRKSIDIINELEAGM